MTKYYVDTNGKLHTLENDEGDEQVKPDWTEVNRADIDQIFNPSSPPPKLRDLNREEFQYLIAVTGFEKTWDALIAVAETEGHKYQLAALRAERLRPLYKFERTLAVVSKYRPLAAQLTPSVDLSDAAIIAAWKEAAAWVGFEVDSE